MLAVISPAKNLNESVAPSRGLTQAPHFLKDAAILADVVKALPLSDLQQLMKLSDNLAQINWQRFQDWRIDHQGAVPAVELFAGDVYQGLDVASMDDAQRQALSQRVCILSGLYGLLRCEDQILPYRLEMGRALKNPRGGNLYQFWKPLVVDLLNQQIEQSPGEKVLINLASQEYFKVVDKRKLAYPVIDVQFRDFSNGQYKVISFFAKKARGMMARFLAEAAIDNLEDLKHFNCGDYRFNGELSSKNVWLFDRSM